MNHLERPILEPDPVGFRIPDHLRISNVGKIHRILLMEFVGFHRPETIGSCYYIRRNPSLGSKTHPLYENDIFQRWEIWKHILKDFKSKKQFLNPKQISFRFFKGFKFNNSVFSTWRRFLFQFFTIDNPVIQFCKLQQDLFCILLRFSIQDFRLFVYRSFSRAPGSDVLPNCHIARYNFFYVVVLRHTWFNELIDNAHILLES
jgi:hypothetical protein